MRVIVAAAGQQTKWGNHLGVRNHFMPVRTSLDTDTTMPLLERTLTQLRGYCDDIWLTAPQDDPEPYQNLAAAHGVHVSIQPAARNEFESSRPIWGEQGMNYLILGDVWFTDEALATILGCTAPGFRFFGREHPSPITGSPWGEIFAQSWHSAANAEMSRLTDEVRAAQDSGRADPTKHGWTMLRLLQGTPLREHIVQPPWWVEINDATDDLDFPRDYSTHPATRGLPTP